MTNVVRMPEAAKVRTWGGIRQRYFDDRVNALKACAKSGMSMTEAAEALGVERAIIYGFIRSYRLEIQFRAPPPISRPDPEMLIRRTSLSKSGITVIQAAKAEGVTVGTMREYSNLHGLKWKPHRHC